MNAKTILAASLAALAIGVGGMGVAGAATQDNSGSSGMMQQGGSPGQSPSTMGDATSSGEGSGMMGGTGTQGVMGSGMMGMHGGGRGDEGDLPAGMRERERTHGGMMGSGMGGGMMGGGAAGNSMMGMMGGCSMAMGAGLDRKTAMKMRGEMMRAMGDILIKYADKIQEPAAKP
jgi:hypothetical protein